MSFYLIYIDEFGDTGFNLEDREQPLLLLQAAMVPVEGDRWQTIEREIVNTIDEASKSTNVNIDRLHFYDMVQRERPFDGVDYSTIFTWIERILDIAKANDTKYVSLPIIKDIFGTREVNGRKGIYFKNTSVKDAKDTSKTFPFSPYLFGYQQLVLLLEQVLEQLDSKGMLIFDQKKEKDVEILSTLNTYRALRAAKLLSRITENPIFRDSRTNAMLTLPDFTANIFGRPLVDEDLKRKTPDKIIAWKERYIDQQTVEAGWPEYEKAGELEGESFEDSLRRTVKGEGPPLIPLQFCILSMMMHEILFGTDLKQLTAIARGFKIISGRKND